MKEDTGTTRTAVYPYIATTAYGDGPPPCELLPGLTSAPKSAGSPSRMPLSVSRRAHPVALGLQVRRIRACTCQRTVAYRQGH